VNLEWRGSSKIGTPYCRSHVNSTPVLVYSIFLLYPLTNIFQSTVIQGTRALRNDLNVVSCGILKVHSEFVLTNYLLFIRCIIAVKIYMIKMSFLSYPTKTTTKTGSQVQKGKRRRIGSIL